MEVNSKLKNAEPIFLLITKFAVILSAAFLIIGISYCVGVDAGYGVPTAESSIEEYTLLGFFVTFIVLGEVFSAMFSGLVANWVLWPAILGVVISLSLLFHFSFRLIPCLRKYEKGFESKLNQLSLTTNSLAVIIFIASFLYLIPISSFQAGRMHAAEVIDQLAKDGCARSFKDTSTWSICSELVSQERIVIKGYMLFRSDSKVAFITHDKQDLIIQNIPEGAVIRRSRVQRNN